MEGPDAEIRAKIKAARRKYETDTRLALIDRQVRYQFVEWCSLFEFLSTRPITALDDVSYLDASNSWVSIPDDDSTYYFEAANPNDYPPRSAFLSRLANVNWPALSSETHRYRVRVDVTAGYGTSADDVPETAKHAMLTLIQHWFENREATVVGTIATEIPLNYQTLVDDLHGEHYP